MLGPFHVGDLEFAEDVAERKVGRDLSDAIVAEANKTNVSTRVPSTGVLRRADRTYQLTFGGNTDFLNMLERNQLESKELSKTRAVTSEVGVRLPEAAVHVGRSDYVAWLSDRKWCYIRMEGTRCGNVPITCEVRLEVWNLPNSAGVVIDVVRLAKPARVHGIAGALAGPSAYLMKSPPRQFPDAEARRLTEAFIAGDTR